MMFKRPRIDDSKCSYYDFNSFPKFTNKISNVISSDISEIETHVRKALVLKNKEISEKNLAFTVVAKENSKLMEDNLLKAKKLEESELPGPVAKTNLLTHSPRKELHPSHFLKRSVMAELRSEKHSVLPVYKFKLLLPFTQYTVPHLST